MQQETKNNNRILLGAHVSIAGGLHSAFDRAHGAYLINLASPDTEKRRKSRKALKHELVRASELSIPHVIIHPGAHMGTGEKQGIRLIGEAIARTFERVPDATARLLLETTTGQGSTLGRSFQQLAAISEAAAVENSIGFCLDTSHVFAAGYDQGMLLKQFVQTGSGNRRYTTGLFLIALGQRHQFLQTHL